MENVPAFTLALLGFGALGLYLLPTMLEVLGGRDRAWVIALNVVAGWTGLAWVAALALALAGRRRSAVRPTTQGLGPGAVPAHPGPIVEGALPPPPREHKARSPVGHA